VLLFEEGRFRPADEQPFQRVEHEALRLRGRPGDAGRPARWRAGEISNATLR